MRNRYADNLSFADAVTRYFSEKTGRGLVASSRDLELLVRWEKTGASAASVCEGIAEAIGGLKRPPRDLFACKKFVEPKLRMAQAAAVGSRRSYPKPRKRSSEEVAVEKWIDAAATATSDVAKSAYAAALATTPTSWDDIETAQRMMVDAALDAAGEPERARIDNVVRERYGEQLSKMSHAYAERTFLAKRDYIVCETFGLVSLID